MDDRLLNINNLRIEFSGSQVAVNDISFHVDRGEIVGIAGPSGSGKSITMWSLVGLIPDRSIASGSLTYYNAENDVRNIQVPHEARRLAGRIIGIIPQNPFTSLNPSQLCGHQIIEMLRDQPISQENKINKAYASLRELGFADPERIYSSYPFELSGGQLQRVVIAMASIADPELIIADEPTTALDVLTQSEVLALLQSVVKKQSRSMFLVSHDLSLLAAFCQRIYMFDKGNITAHGTPAEVLAGYSEKVLNTNKSEETDANPDLCRLDQISISYRSRSGVLVDAVKKFSLKIRQGEAVGLVGSTGCGKSSVAKACTGLIFPYEGKMHFGQPEWDFRKHPDLRKKVQMIFQDPYSALYPHFTVGSYLREAIRHHRIASKSNEEKMIIESLQEVGLDSTFARRFPHELSGGERQRVQIARALLIRPQLLICDEITSGLDIAVQAQILGLLNKIRKTDQMSMLMISHDLQVVRHMVDRIVIMEQGRVVEEGSTDRIFSHPMHELTRALINGFTESKVARVQEGQNPNAFA